MDDRSPLSDREITLVEEYGIIKRKLEIQELFIAAMVARLGGTVKLSHDELEFARKNYILGQEVSWDDRTIDAKMHVRLR